MNGNILLIIILVLLLGGVGPWWPHSHSWGPWPGGIVGLILLILIIRAFL